MRDSNALRFVKKMQVKRRSQGMTAAEAWVFAALQSTGYIFIHEHRWYFKLMDFWCEELGVNVEVDGREHVRWKDRKRDKMISKRTAVVVLRVRNFNQADLDKALFTIRCLAPWRERKLREARPGHRRRREERQVEKAEQAERALDAELMAKLL